MPVIDLGSVVGPQGQQGVAGATGAQGIQGNPGPNQVTDQTSTNLNGVLFGNQSRVAVKPVDSTPTADSTNLVSSGGVYNAVQTVEQQIAYVEDGTTASRAYDVGEYFCWNGLLYRVISAISSGGTFTPGTNCEQMTGGGLNNINSKLNEFGKQISNGTSEVAKYTVFMLLLKDNWATGSNRILVAYIKGTTPYYTWDVKAGSTLYHNIFEVSINGNTIGTTHVYSTTNSTTPPSVVSIIGVC